MRVIVLSIDRRRAPTPRPGSTRRSASAATPARARSSSLRAYGDAGDRRGEPRHGPPAPRRPRRRLVAGRRARQCRRRPPLGRIAQRRITDAATQTDPSACARTRSASTTRPATPTSPGPASPLARAARRRARPAAVRAGHRASRSAAPPTRRRPRCWPRGCGSQLDVPVDWRYLARGRVDRRHPRRCASTARAATIELERVIAGRRDASRQPGQPEHDSSLPRRTCATASPRSSVASTRTTCMVE